MPLYLIICALSSFLLFLIQPIAAKTLLPILGGVPAVWNTCMVFFQGMLLIGYLYAFLLTRYLSGFWQCLMHASVMLLSLLMIPILISGLVPLGQTHPIIYVMTTLFASISLPLFILTATAPLVQSWFGHTSHPDAKDPYFLYSASNAGSLLALLSFPFVLEPFAGSQTLALVWSVLYGALIILLLTIALQQRNQHTTPHQTLGTISPSWKQRTYWLALSFAPSSLLLAVTQYITTNIASVPLLWIIPLALYLISFIIVFSRQPIISHQWMVRQLPFFLVFTLLSFVKIIHAIPMIQLIAFHLVGFFALIMVCHGELAAQKPDKSYLTEFYFWLALGGFLGGVFNSLIAPFIFNDIYEYYLAICLCVYLSPSTYTTNRKAILFPMTLLALLGVVYVLQPYLAQISEVRYWILAVELISITVVVTWHQRSLIFAINLGIIFILIQSTNLSNMGDLIWRSRNFFGVSKIYSDDSSHLRVYINGVTLHGAQLIENTSVKTQALTYYRPIFILSDFLHLAKQDNKPLRVAIAGLGTGTLSCAFNNDETTFFEINPTVIAIANTPKYFTYLNNCPARGGIKEGDARYQLSLTKSHYFDIILIDTFSSDAIPTHLITIDAVKMYLDKLNPQGMLIFHISNTHLDLKPLLFAIAGHLNLQGLTLGSMPIFKLDYASEWVVLTKDTHAASDLQKLLKWKQLTRQKSIPVWTDDYSNILQVIR